MDILFDHQMFSIQRFGGISRVFVELMRELSKNPDCRIQWFRGFYLDKYDIQDFRSRLKRYQGYHEPAFLSGFVDNYRNQLNRLLLPIFVNTAVRRTDIYHPTYYDSSLAKSVNAKHRVATIYDMIAEKFLSATPLGKKMAECKREMVRNADLVFAISLSTIKDLRDILNVPDSKIRLTHLASRMDEIEEEKLPEDLSNKPFFLYVGTRSKYKNFTVAMKAFAESEWLRANFRLVCCGGSSPFLEPELNFMREHGLLDNFAYVTGSDGLLKSLYKNAQALVYTSRYEGFGLPLLEAMECHCPVICCRVSSIPEVTGPSALFFDPDSSEDLAACMRKIVQNFSLRDTMIMQGAEKAKEFSWKKTADAVWRGYKEIG